LLVVGLCCKHWIAASPASIVPCCRLPLVSNSNIRIALLHHSALHIHRHSLAWLFLRACLYDQPLICDVLPVLPTVHPSSSPCVTTSSLGEHCPTFVAGSASYSYWQAQLGMLWWTQLLTSEHITGWQHGKSGSSLLLLRGRVACFRSACIRIAAT
jgi:hypothetical protein